MWASFPGELLNGDVSCPVEQSDGLRTVLVDTVWTGDLQDGSDAFCGGGQTFRIKHIQVVSQWMGAWSPAVGHVFEAFPHRYWVSLFPLCSSNLLCKCVPGLVTGSCRPPPWSDEAAGVFQSTRVFFFLIFVWTDFRWRTHPHKNFLPVGRDEMKAW